VSDRHQKTERATPRRRQKAREQGQVPRSRDLVSVASLGGGLFALPLLGGQLAERLAALTGGLLRLGFGRDPGAALRAASAETVRILWPFLACSALLAVAAGAAQGGLVVRPLSVDLSRVDPAAGVRRLFSAGWLAESGKNLIKLAAGALLVGLCLREGLAALPAMAGADLGEAAAGAGRLVMRAVSRGFWFFLVLAGGDWVLERWRFERSIRMTKEEVKDEYRETEGNPQVKARIRSLMRDLARRRMMQEVPRAAVVVTNPVHVAVALRYEAGRMPAPRIVAKGAGVVAERIKEVARRHGVPIVEDRPLARTLFRLELGSFVPEELYRAVAKILAQIWLRAGRRPA